MQILRQIKLLHPPMCMVITASGPGFGPRMFYILFEGCSMLYLLEVNRLDPIGAFTYGHRHIDDTLGNARQHKSRHLGKNLNSRITECRQVVNANLIIKILCLIKHTVATNRM